MATRGRFCGKSEKPGFDLIEIKKRFNFERTWPFDARASHPEARCSIGMRALASLLFNDCKVAMSGDGDARRRSRSSHGATRCARRMRNRPPRVDNRQRFASSRARCCISARAAAPTRRSRWRSSTKSRQQVDRLRLQPSGDNDGGNDMLGDDGRARAGLHRLTHGLVAWSTRETDMSSSVSPSLPQNPQARRACLTRLRARPMRRSGARGASWSSARADFICSSTTRASGRKRRPVSPRTHIRNGLILQKQFIGPMIGKFGILVERGSTDD